MLIRRPDPIPPSQITPKDVFLDRRRFLASAAAAAVLPSALAASPARPSSCGGSSLWLCIVTK